MANLDGNGISKENRSHAILPAPVRLGIRQAALGIWEKIGSTSFQFKGSWRDASTFMIGCRQHILLPLGRVALGQYNQDMKNAKPAYVVYYPPAYGFPFLAVILADDGTVTARAFDTAEEAAAFNRQMARSQFPGKRTH